MADDISWDDVENQLTKAGSAAASGGMAAGLPGALIGGGLSLAMPALSNMIGNAFGAGAAKDAQRAAVAPLDRIAQGGTTQAQAGASYARGRTMQDLAAQAAQGTAQQQAGLRQKGMELGMQANAQQGASLADLRAKEQEHAAAQAAYYKNLQAAQALKSSQESAAGAAKGLGEAATKFFLGATSPAAGAATAASDAALKKSLGIGAPAAGGISSEQAGAALFGAPAAAAPAAAGVSAVGPGIAKGPTLAGPATSDDWAKAMGAPQYDFQMKGATKGAEELAAEDKMAQQYADLARKPGKVVRAMPGITPSEVAMRDAQNQATFDTLAGQRSGAVSAIPAMGPSNASAMATADSLRGKLQTDPLDPEVAAAMKTEPWKPDVDLTRNPFGAPDLNRSSYAGALYEAPRPVMNNTRMAIHDRMRKSLENQVGPLAPAPNLNMSPMPPSGREFSDLQSQIDSVNASTNPFGTPPEDVRMRGLRRSAKILGR